MSEIDKIPGIFPLEIKALQDQKIQTITALWQRIGSDFKNGISTLADQANIKPERLIELLKAQALQESKSREASWPSRHWLELGLLALLLLVAGLFFYARSTGVLSWAAAPIGWGQPGQVRQVVAARDLPAYHRIVLEDLAEGVRPAQQGGITDQAEALGRFTLKEVASGSVLLSDSLSAPAAATSGEYALVSLPIARHMLSLVSPGKPASFLLAPREPGSDCQGGVTPLVGIVLATEEQQEGVSILVAMPSSQLDVLSLCLGLSDVVVVR